jgi:membrane protease YdiL (CAAX protease family)
MTQPSEPAPWGDFHEAQAPLASGAVPAAPQHDRDFDRDFDHDRDRDVEALVVPWTARQTWIGVGLTLGPWLLLALATLALAARTPSSAQLRSLSPLEDAVGGVLAFGVTSVLEATFLAAPLVFALRTRPAGSGAIEALRALGFRRFDWRVAALWVVIAAGLGFAASSLYDQVKGPLGLQTNTDTLAEQIKVMPLTTLGLLLAGALVAPLCEEVFFRGFLLPGAARSMPVWAAIIVSSALFGIAHADLGSLAPLIVIGLLLGVVRYKTRSLWPPIFLHTLNNAIALIALLPLLPR